MNQHIIANVRTAAANLLELSHDSYQFPNSSLLRLLDHIGDFPISLRADLDENIDDEDTPAVSALTRLLLVEREFSMRELKDGAPISKQPPIIITGLPGTGASLLQSLLACDTENRTFLKSNVIDIVDIAVEKRSDNPVSATNVFNDTTQQPCACSEVLAQSLHYTLTPLMQSTKIVKWMSAERTLFKQFRFHRRFAQIVNARHTEETLEPRKQWSNFKQIEEDEESQDAEAMDVEVAVPLIAGTEGEASGNSSVETERDLNASAQLQLESLPAAAAAAAALTTTTGDTTAKLQSADSSVSAEVQSTSAEPTTEQTELTEQTEQDKKRPRLSTPYTSTATPTPTTPDTLNTSTPSADLHHLPTRWVFQDPSHLRTVEILHQVYPKARVIWTHRKLREQVNCYVGKQFHTEQNGKAIPNISRLLKESELGGMLDEVIDYRDTHPTPSLFHDVYLEDLSTDPIGTVRGIYAHFQLGELSDQHVKAMLSWLGKNFRPAVDYKLSLNDLSCVTRGELLEVFKTSKYAQRFPRVMT